MGSDEDGIQLAFRDGELVPGPAGGPSRVDTADPVVPNERTGFRLSVKPGAFEVNDAIEAICDDNGRVLSFGSRADAETFAAQCSTDDGSVQVQAAAPNDPDDVDGYLLAEYARSVSEPASVDDGTWTFDVGANRYGALGETLVTAGSTPPAIRYFVERDLDPTPADLDDLHVEVSDADPVAVESPDGAGRLRWHPDCYVEARDGWDGEPLATYWAEVKTGDASFERSQRAAMRAFAADHRVLKIRVDVDGLPDSYAVRIQDVPPPDD